MGVAARVSEQCRIARLDAGLRTLDLAQAAGVSEAVISRFERGLRWPVKFEAIVAAYENELGLERDELWRRALRL